MKLNKILSLVGLPNTLTNYQIKIDVNDICNFINHFSFEGMTKELYNIGDLYIVNAYDNTYNMHIGKYNFSFNKKQFILPKRILNYMIKNNDYIINCNEN